ncbi:hypothetical protein ACG2LH_18100 [Zhouia sp. PK063]|uniref:hypothetical protein n=1 Tax=Zhouia sp. PK063 TaxID=3373602 RepID=UPI0037956B89
MRNYFWKSGVHSSIGGFGIPEHWSLRNNMTIGKPFNQLKIGEYMLIMEQHTDYTDFNTLGLYRSLLENSYLSLEERLQIREKAHTYFQKTFEFLQLKDPQTYFEVLTLGERLTQGDVLNHWRMIRENQQRILQKKRIKHRNFGTYSKHDCGYDYCPYNGLMIRQGSILAETSICFKQDKHKDEKRNKSIRLAKEKRMWKKNLK